MEIEDLKIVADDLEYLAEWGPNITDREIRHGSAILRRLLVEDVYGRAWRSIGRPKQPTLIAVDISPITFPDNLSEIVFALAGGAHYRGMKMACMIVNKGKKPIGNIGPPVRDDGYPGEHEFSLSEFLSSVSGVSEGKLFYRREVIKYFANVKGGVHLSQKARKAEKKLVDRLGKIEKKIIIHSSDGLLVELVAIGQALGGSNDAKEFVEYVKKL